MVSAVKIYMNKNTERRAVTARIRAYKKRNPNATRAQAKRDLTREFKEAGINPDRLKFWLQLLVMLLPLSF